MRLLSIREVQASLLELMKKVHTFMGEHQLNYYLLGGSALGAVRHNGFIPWDDDIDIGMFREDYERFLEICDDFSSDYEVVNFKRRGNCNFVLTRIYINNTYIADPSVENTKLDKRLYFDIFPLDNVPDNKIELDKFEKQVLSKKMLAYYIDEHKYGNNNVKNIVKKITALVLNPFRGRILVSYDKLLKKYRNCETQRICSLCSQYSFAKQVMLKSVYGKPTLHKFEEVELYIPENIDSYLTTLFGEDYMQIPPENKRRKGFDIYKIEED